DLNPAGSSWRSSDARSRALGDPGFLLEPVRPSGDHSLLAGGRNLSAGQFLADGFHHRSEGPGSCLFLDRSRLLLILCRAGLGWPETIRLAGNWHGLSGSLCFSLVHRVYHRSPDIGILSVTG